MRPSNKTAYALNIPGSQLTGSPVSVERIFFWFSLARKLVFKNGILAQIVPQFVPFVAHLHTDSGAH